MCGQHCNCNMTYHGTQLDDTDLLAEEKTASRFAAETKAWDQHLRPANNKQHKLCSSKDTAVWEIMTCTHIPTYKHFSKHERKAILHQESQFEASPLTLRNLMYHLLRAKCIYDAGLCCSGPE